jgi:hypothetical protein
MALVLQSVDKLVDGKFTSKTIPRAGVRISAMCFWGARWRARPRCCASWPAWIAPKGRSWPTARTSRAWACATQRGHGLPAVHQLSFPDRLRQHRFTPQTRGTAQGRNRPAGADTAAMLHIDNLLSRLPAELSGGQQQRTAIARALVKEAQLLLLDEPLVNLDYKLREELRDELQQIFEQRRRRGLHHHRTHRSPDARRQHRHHGRRPQGAADRPHGRGIPPPGHDAGGRSFQRSAHQLHHRRGRCGQGCICASASICP